MSDDSKGPKRRRRRRRKQGGGSGEGRSSGGDGSPKSKSRRRRRGKGSGEARSKDGGPRSDSGRQRRRQSEDRSERDREHAREELLRQQPAPALDRADFVDSDTDDEVFEADTDESEDTPVTELAPDLPEEPDDPDPSTVDVAGGFDTGAVHDLVGVKFHSAGKIYLFDSGREYYQVGEDVIVESDGGGRWGTVATATERRTHKRKNLKRILRRPSDEDHAKAERRRASEHEMLRTAKTLARRSELSLKVFRVDSAGSKVTVYFSSEGKVDPRPLVRELSREWGCRVDTRQTGVRDEAKLVGGIGSCGQELCCTTWLPSFVPVSIRHAKDQGLVLNPTKVSGQCGRLKCCLVYEHATYAEMRKGLPKLGKRVVTDDGEGRVVEVDVLRQRIRVNLVEGSAKVYGKGEVEPMFPSQKPSDKGKGGKSSSGGGKGKSKGKGKGSKSKGGHGKGGGDRGTGGNAPKSSD